MTDKPETLTIEHAGMAIGFTDTENGLMQYTFNTESNLKSKVPAIPFPPFELAVAGIPYGHSPALIAGLTNLPREMKLQSWSSDEEKLTMAYKHERLGLKVETELRFIPGAAVIRQSTVVTNEGTLPVVLTHVSSMCVQGIATDGGAALA
ncbi:hypothetical protein OMP38_28060 [Cohnella ginsengisoli]|uniref:Phage tail protein n=1 Tax=Cohnella ginsengisoli TaxID=425004 RepID=A0A9X4KL75_9BACL|nr:glycoside hydrolase family 36 N-terminal domain-containing protein [Cohnella ginsengisoli]MDG0794262.1 hypothetical protein [Cohnella ginsengisoli]